MKRGKTNLVGRIPKGFRPKAQGCEERATLGNRSHDEFNPNGVVVRFGVARTQPRWGWNFIAPPTQGSSFLATLIGVPKLFAGGEESLWNLSPQPTVNNFARRVKDFCEQLRRAVRPALTPCWMTNTQPVSSDESAQSFAPARRLDSRRILRCGQSDVSSIRPSLSPSQRARNSNSTQRQS